MVRHSWQGSQEPESVQEAQKIGVEGRGEYHSPNDQSSLYAKRWHIYPNAHDARRHQFLACPAVVVSVKSVIGLGVKYHILP